MDPNTQTETPNETTDEVAEGEAPPEPAAPEGEAPPPAEGEAPPEEPQPEGPIDYSKIEQAEILGGIEVPEGFELKLDEDNKALQWWQNYAKENNVPKEVYVDAIQQFVKQQLDDLGDPAAEIAKLGDNGKEMVTKVDHWLSETLKRHYGSTEEGRAKAQADYEALANSVTTAEGVRALHTLYQISMDTGVPANPGGQAGTAQPMTMKDIEKMMEDPRYRDPMKRDEGYHAEVRRAMEQLIKAGG